MICVATKNRFGESVFCNNLFIFNQILFYLQVLYSMHIHDHYQTIIVFNNIPYQLIIIESNQIYLVSILPYRLDCCVSSCTTQWCFFLHNSLFFLFQAFGITLFFWLCPEGLQVGDDDDRQQFDTCYTGTNNVASRKPGKKQQCGLTNRRWIPLCGHFKVQFFDK